jgi:hypothetical protein
LLFQSRRCCCLYGAVIYEPARPTFEKQLSAIDSLIVAKHIMQYFTQAQRFYRATWDPSIPFWFVFYPQPLTRGFSATAFRNISMSALPVSYTDFTGILTVMLHESSHILFDDLIDRKFPYNHQFLYLHDFSLESFDRLVAGGTKFVIIHNDNKRKLDLVKRRFPSLARWEPDARKDFSQALLLPDHTQLIVVNLVSTALEQQLEGPLIPSPAQ